jgi:DNA-binding response OmpR family regulator
METATVRNEGRPPYCDAHLVIDFRQRTVLLDSGVIELTTKEFDLLAFLAEHAGEVLPRGSLLSVIWGYSEQTRTRTLDVHLARIRKKFGTLGHRYIETIFGAGCRFQPQAGCAAGAESGNPVPGTATRESDRIELRVRCKPSW